MYLVHFLHIMRYLRTKLHVDIRVTILSTISPYNSQNHASTTTLVVIQSHKLTPSESQRTDSVTDTVTVGVTLLARLDALESHSQLFLVGICSPVQSAEMLLD